MKRKVKGGSLVRAARERKSLTVAELALLSGVNVRTIQNWERGIQKPRPKTVRMVFEALSGARDLPDIGGGA